MFNFCGLKIIFKRFIEDCHAPGEAFCPTGESSLLNKMYETLFFLCRHFGCSGSRSRVEFPVKKKIHADLDPKHCLCVQLDPLPVGRGEENGRGPTRPCSDLRLQVGGELQRLLHTGVASSPKFRLRKVKRPRKKKRQNHSTAKL
jgi:hypothetical protein